MANRYPRQKRISLIQQTVKITSTYDNVVSTDISRNTLSCILNVTPSKHSITYKVRISYRIGSYPTALLLDPPLEKYDGKNPHHLYEFSKSGKPRLCVYYPKYKEWNCNMYIADTFIPWVSTWLHTYEYWLITGEWHYAESPHKMKESV